MYFYCIAFSVALGRCVQGRTPERKKEGLLPRSSIAVNRNVITQRRFPFFFPSSSSSSAPPTVSCQTHGERKYILYARSCIPIRYVTHSSLMEGASKLFSFFFFRLCSFFSLFSYLFLGVLHQHCKWLLVLVGIEAARAHGEQEEELLNAHSDYYSLLGGQEIREAEQIENSTEQYFNISENKHR